MKNFFKKLFGKAEAEVKETYKYEPRANNIPEMEVFSDRVRSGNYAEVHRLLKGGFDPNQQYEYVDGSSYDNGAIVDTYVVRGQILDVVRDEAMKKLLRAFGAKTSEELLAEEMAAKRAAEAAEKEKKMKIVDELLAQ